jgi:hypothetical protein
MKKIYFLICLILFFFHFPREAQSQKPKDSDYFYFIGTLHENHKNSFYPSEYFILEEETIYQGYTHRAGGVNLLFIKPPPSNLEGSVILEGYLKKDLTQNLRKIKKAKLDDFGSREHKMMRIRSDWLPPENIAGNGDILSWVPGVTTRERLQSLKYYEVHSLKMIDILEIEKKENSQIKITITNPLSVQLPPTTLAVRYEGGRGKPSSKYLHFEVPALEQNASHSVTVDPVHIVQYTKVNGDKFYYHGAELTANTSKFIIKVNAIKKYKD